MNLTPPENEREVRLTRGQLLDLVLHIKDREMAGLPPGSYVTRYQLIWNGKLVTQVAGAPVWYVQSVDRMDIASALMSAVVMCVDERKPKWIR